MSEVSNSNIVNRLFKSFEELESAIEGARTNLEKKPSVPAHVFERLKSYDQILKKQRSLALILAEYVKRGDSGQVARYVTIINGLSGMIIEDARSILSSLSADGILASNTSGDDDINLC